MHCTGVERTGSRTELCPNDRRNRNVRGNEDAGRGNNRIAIRVEAVDDVWRFERWQVPWRIRVDLPAAGQPLASEEHPVCTPPKKAAHRGEHPRACRAGIEAIAAVAIEPDWRIGSS